MTGLFKIKTSNIQITLVIFSVFFMLFRPAFIAKFGSLGQLSILVAIIAIIVLVPKVKCHKNQIFLFVFPVYVTIVAIFHTLSVYNGSYYEPPLIGLYVIVVPYLFWLIMSQAILDFDVRKIEVFFIYAGVVNVFGAVIFFFYDPLVFGLVGESIYSNATLMAKGNIDLRARTFIGTPQTVGAYAAILLFFTYSTNYFRKYVKFIFIILFLLLGMISGSKSFYLSLAVSITAFSLCTKVRLRYLVLLSLMPVFLYFFQDDSGIFRRVIGAFTYLEKGIDQHPTFQAWNEVFAYDINVWGFLFGHGVGALSRAGQEFYPGRFPFSTAESFILQFFFEVGLVGFLIAFGSMLYLARSTFRKRDYANFAIILGVFANMLVSPSFYGVAFSFFGYYFLFKSQYKSVSQ